MAVSATSALVATFAGDAARPPGHAGWNNPVGDPHWIPDYDWYRRVQLACVAGAGEDTRTVNWECYDDTVQFQTTTVITTGATYTAAVTPPALPAYGSVVNNSTTWTIWAYNGATAANTIKYSDTGVPAVSKFRANGQRVQILLGNRKKIGAASTLWTIAAFLPGGGRLPAATTTITVSAPTVTTQPTAEILSLRSAPEQEDEDTVEPEAVVPKTAARKSRK